MDRNGGKFFSVQQPEVLFLAISFLDNFAHAEWLARYEYNNNDNLDLVKGIKNEPQEHSSQPQQAAARI